MKAHHNINEPIETIINQIETAINFTDDGKVPYTPEQVVNTAYELIFVNRIFCRHLPPMDPEAGGRQNLGGVHELLHRGTQNIVGHTSHVYRRDLPVSQGPRGGKQQGVVNHGLHRPPHLFNIH